MKNIPDSLTPDQAWSRLASHPMLSAEIRPLEDSLGYHLVHELRVPQDIPESHRSFMDGFAVRSSDVAQVPARLKIVGEILMGLIPEKNLKAGEAMFIPTGGFLPDGADAVVMQEDTERIDQEVLIHRTVAYQENLQLRAEDFKRDEILFSSQHRLRAQDIGALATFGMTEVAVIRKPSIVIISTGNELVEFHKQPQPGQIRETNALSLAIAARQFGFTVHLSGIVIDRVEQQKEAMAIAMNLADVVLVSGGSSVGERDYTLDVIRSFSGSSVLFHGLAIRPGNPTIYASIGRHSVFGLPGQPVSSLIVFYQFVLPFLFHLSGEKIDYAHFPQTKFANMAATLDQNIKPLKLKTDYVRLRLRREKEIWLATPVPGKSASLSTLAQADAFTIVPPGEELIPAGDGDYSVSFSLKPPRPKSSKNAKLLNSKKS